MPTAPVSRCYCGVAPRSGKAPGEGHVPQAGDAGEEAGGLPEGEVEGVPGWRRAPTGTGKSFNAKIEGKKTEINCNQINDK